MIFNPIVPKMGPRTVQSLEIGDSLWCEVDGIRTELIVVNQGNPDTTKYETSCDGTWCLFKNNTGNQAFDSSSSNRYEASSINNWLNNVFINKSNICSIIKQVKIPYAIGGGVDTERILDQGLPVKMFLLSTYESRVTAYNYKPVVGKTLSYFSSGGTYPANWWSRDPVTNSTFSAWAGMANSDTAASADASRTYYGVFPAFILPFDTKIDKDNNIVAPPVSQL